MRLDRIRDICGAFPGVTEDVKWESDLVFSIGGKMFAVVCLDPPHTLAFKCTPEEYAQLVERPGMIPAPYLARAMWVQEQEPGSLDLQKMPRLLRTSYELVRAKLPKSWLKGGTTRSRKRARKPGHAGRSRRRR